jgi:hypothetical protein
MPLMQARQQRLGEDRVADPGGGDDEDLQWWPFGRSPVKR